MHDRTDDHATDDTALDRGDCYRALLARDARYDGRFHTAVLTTGIYCRPVCPAGPPKLESCVFVVSAKAALAMGFRPCLRCRPEVPPGLLGGRAPTTSRRSAVARAPAATRGGAEGPPLRRVTLRLPFCPPYDWRAMIEFLGARAIPAVEEVERDRYRRTFSLGGGARGTIEVWPAAGEDHLLATVRTSLLESIPEVAARVRRVFDLDADITAADAHLGRDPLLAARVRERPGVRVPGAWDPFEIAVRAVLGQQITVRAATTFAGRLAAELGEPLDDDGAGRAPGTRGPSRLFPAPASMKEADLTVIGLTRARAAALRGLASAAAERGWLRSRGTLEDTVAALCALPGVGPWTAHYIAMRALHEPDAFPSTDLGLLRALETARGRPSPAELAEKAEAWRPWRAYAALRLWSQSA